MTSFQPGDWVECIVPADDPYFGNRCLLGEIRQIRFINGTNMWLTTCDPRKGGLFTGRFKIVPAPKSALFNNLYEKLSEI